MDLSEILMAPDIVRLNFPYNISMPDSDLSKYFSGSELGDMLSFGFSFVEKQDHVVEYILVNPGMAKRIVKEISDFEITPETEYLGLLWTAKIYVTDKVEENIVFSNADYLTILELHLNKMEDLNGQV